MSRLFAVLLAFVVLAGPTRAQTFKSAKILNVGEPVDYVTSADINEDGKVDLIYLPGGNVNPLPLRVLLGNGDGAFQPPVTLNVTAREQSLFAIADVNHDGKPDLIIPGGPPGLSALIVYLGNGDGTFQSGIVSNGASGADYRLPIGFGDFNGDGNVDVVLEDGVGQNMTVFLGDGQGHFTLKSSMPEYDFAARIFVDDLNHDGHLDFVVHNSNGASATVYLGNGDGTFHAPVTYSPADHIFSMLLQDMNSDGSLDMVTTNLNGGVEIFPGNADGTFSSTSISGATYRGALENLLAVQDLNNDGVNDLLTFSSNGVGVLLGKTALTFGAPKFYPASTPVLALDFASPAAMGDFNGDGHADLAIPLSNGIALLFGNADGSFQTADAYAISYQTANVAVGDLNGDGIPDLAVGVYYGLPQIFLGNGDGTFHPLPDQSGSSPPASSTLDGQLFLGDFNGDQKQDILGAESHGFLLYGNGDGTYSLPPTTSINGITDFSSSGAADLNGDGVMDLAVTTNGSVTILLSQPDHSFQSIVVPLPASSGSMSFGFGDFNGDGKIDVAVTTFLPHSLIIIFNNGNGTFTAGNAVSLLSSNNPGVAVGDFDGDGKLDIALPYPGQQTTNVAVLFGNGDGTFQSPAILVTPHAAAIVSAGDLNGDGIADLILSDGYFVTVIHGTSARKFGPPRDYLAGNAPTFAMVADLNGDGGPDLVFANAQVNEVNTVTVLLNLSITKGNLTVTPSPGAYGEPLNISATYAPTVAAAGMPTGSVAFSIDGGATTNANLQGVATFRESQILAVGTHSVSATWAGDQTFNPHNLSGQFIVNQASSTTSLNLSPTVVIAGQPATLTARVQPPFQGVPTGTLQFLSGTTLLKTITLDPTDQATYSLDTTSLAIGPHSYTASYSGDTNFTSSTSPGATLMVGDYSVATNPSSLTVNPGSSGIVNVTVSAISGYNGAIDLSCTGLPAGAQCLFASASISLANASSATTSLTISTTNSAWLLPSTPSLRSHLPRLFTLSAYFLIAAIGVLLLSRRKPAMLPRADSLTLLALLVAAVLLAGCGGGGSGGGKVTSYTIQVQGSVHGSSPAITRSATITLNVQH